MNIVIDFGNSFAKVGIFEQDKLVQTFVTGKNESSQVIQQIPLSNYQSAIISTVIDSPDRIMEPLKNICKKVIAFDKTTCTTLTNKYTSPETLGNDRLALASGAAMLYKNRNILIIDAGSCITFDFVNEMGEYIGGAISPGIDMRFKALNAFTDKLPLLHKENTSLFTGRNTKESMLSGVMNGVYSEINSSINYYKRNYKNLEIVLCGGDAIFLSKKIKSRIFAEPNFLLISLNQILLHNE